MRLFRLFRCKNGFTFIEILIVLFITSIIAITMIPILNMSSNSNQYDVTTVEDLQQARRAIKRITDEINYANLNNPIVINTNPSGNSLLNYNNSNGNACNIFLNGGTIFFQQSSLAPVAITTQNTVRALQFQFNNSATDNRSIIITITLRNNKTVTSTARQLNRRI